MAVRILFVHGVANRKEGNEASFAADQARMRAMFKRALGEDTEVRFPYWGDLGGKLRWNGQCLPTSKLQAFGIAPHADAPILIDSSTGSSSPLLAIARRSGPEALVDLIAIGLADQETLPSNEFAEAMGEFHDFALSPWPWLAQVKDDSELALQIQIQYAVWRASLNNGTEAFGLIDSISQGFKRITGSLVNSASDTLMLKVKPALTQGAVRFFGDIFVYLDAGRTEIQMEILKELNALRSQTSEADKLVVICHSFGGPIFTDMLFDPYSGLPSDLQIDALITVGSQVGLFAEMDLYSTKFDLNGKPDPAKLTQAGKIPMPKQVLKWLNVLDLADPLAFRLAPIIEGAEDAQFNTDTSLLNAHNTYFVRPSFYDRLKARRATLGI